MQAGRRHGDRQMDRQTDRQAGRETDKSTHRRKQEVIRHEDSYQYMLTLTIEHVVEALAAQQVHELPLLV